MHARLPARNVILASGRSQHNRAPTYTRQCQVSVSRAGGSQVRIYPRYVRLLDGLRQRLQPALGLPLERVLAPDRLVGVHGAHVDEDFRAFRHRDLGNDRSVDAADGLQQRQDGVRMRPMSRIARSLVDACGKDKVVLTLGG